MKTGLQILEEMRAKPYQLDLGNGQIVDVQKLNIDHIAEFGTFQEKGDSAGGMVFMIMNTLKSIEGVNDELINELEPGIIVKILPQILKANGFGSEEEIKKKEI